MDRRQTCLFTFRRAWQAGSDVPHHELLGESIRHQRSGHQAANRLGLPRPMSGSRRAKNREDKTKNLKSRKFWRADTASPRSTTRTSNRTSKAAMWMASVRCSSSPDRASPRARIGARSERWAYGLSRAMDYLEKDNRCRREARRDHGPLAARENGSLGGRNGYALRHGDCQLFGRRRRLTLPASLWRDDCQSGGCFSFWFSVSFQDFVDHADRLPVDAHELIALIAPRPVYITGARMIAGPIPRASFSPAWPQARSFGYWVRRTLERIRCRLSTGPSCTPSASMCARASTR